MSHSKNKPAFRADLHCHTTCSDGSLTPSELIDLAVSKGLAALSITDHDTVEAYPAAQVEAEAKGLELVPGVELSARHGDEPIHILGYGFSIEEGSLPRFCARHVARRQQRNNGIIQKLQEHGFEVTYDEVVALCGVEGKQVYGRPHIAQVMVEKGYVGSISEAFTKWIGEGKPCYTPGDLVTVQETIDIIHAAGGKAVIAHPFFIKKKKTVKYLMSLNFDGIECFYASMPRQRIKPWIDRAKDKGWLMTGGSDFHGRARPENELGASWVDEATYRALQATVAV